MKKSADSDSVSDSRRRHYKLIYTGHRTQRLSTGGRQMRLRCTSQAIVTGTDATQPHYHRPTRRAPDNNAEAIIISDGHPKGPDTSASRPQQDALPPSTHGIKRSLQPYAHNKWPTTWLESVRGHGLCQTSGAPQTPRSLHKPRYSAARCHSPHARGRWATRSPAAMQAAANRRLYGFR